MFKVGRRRSPHNLDLQLLTVSMLLLRLGGKDIRKISYINLFSIPQWLGISIESSRNGLHDSQCSKLYLAIFALISSLRLIPWLILFVSVWLTWKPSTPLRGISAGPHHLNSHNYPVRSSPLVQLAPLQCSNSILGRAPKSEILQIVSRQLSEDLL